ADVAVADDAQRLAAHLVAAGGRLQPVAAQAGGVARGHAAQQHDGLRQHQFGHAAGVGVGRVEHRHALASGSLQVDLVGADAEAAHRHQPPRIGQDLGRQLRARADADDVRFADALAQHGLGQRAGVGFDVGIAGVAEHGHRARAQALQQQHADVLAGIGGLHRRRQAVGGPPVCQRAGDAALQRWTLAGPAGRLQLRPGRLAMNDAKLESLRAAVPGLRVLTAPDELLHYGRDWTRRWTPAPLAIALPGDVGQAQAVLRWASAEGVAVVPSGGRTGLSGGAVAANGELVLSLERMRRVLAFDPIDRTLTVEAGAPLEAVQEAAREHGLQ